jgi:hypothetical protein
MSAAARVLRELWLMHPHTLVLLISFTACQLGAPIMRVASTRRRWC